MATTVSYKGNTIATLNNETKTLTTAGTWVEGNIVITDTSSGGTGGTSSGSGSSTISLIDTITISANARGISIDLSTYLSNYDILIITQDVTLSESDWLYYSPNVSSPTGGSYNDGSKINHTGVCFWYLPLGGSSKYCYGYIASAVFSQSNVTNTPISNLYIYTYVSTKMITAGSTFKVYGGNYADL